ncbi:MAG: hypothetical protein ROO76_20895 [Terriglobia bacterium]|nr:hypothetical protein [Terriglobia bacterium]
MVLAIGVLRFSSDQPTFGVRWLDYTSMLCNQIVDCWEQLFRQKDRFQTQSTREFGKRRQPWISKPVLNSRDLRLRHLELAG